MLLVDSGNSRIKWALAEDQEWRLEGAVDQSAGALWQAFAALPQPDGVIVSNVAGDDAEQRIRAACAAWPCPVRIIAASGALLGVQNGYDRPGQLGSDRWAALIAAWHRERAACLVVNCGTATTIDALSPQGEFLGGLILPGIEMMRRSLAAGTAQLAQESGSWSRFPRNTGDAVFSGAIQATAGAIRRQFEMLGADGARCLLSGGAADTVQPHLDIPHERVPDLVLHGLHRIGLEACS
jgi:type III pantothenate kinase